MKTKLIKASGGKSYWLLTEGACSVKIYSTNQTKNGTAYETHCVAYSEGRKRIRKTFGDLGKAKNWAQVVLTRLSNGDTQIKGLSSVDLQDLTMAKQELVGLGISLTAVAKEYRLAIERLGSKGTIGDAIRFFVTNASPDLPEKPTPEVVQELCVAKEQDGLSVRYREDLKMRLGKFAKAFTGPISRIQTVEIETWLRGLGARAKNRNNYANAITTLFNFAKRNGYLAQDRVTAAENLSRAKNVEGAVEIYTVVELKTILDRLKALKPEFVPLVAIGAFAGVRTAELSRMMWEHIDFEHNLIEIPAKNSKTAQRRYIPIQPNLALWLAPYRESKGLVWTLKKIQIPIRRVIEPTGMNDGVAEEGVKWKPNALRHSFGSYRLPIIKSAAELALEMGNSPAMIFRHYRELVKPAEAVKFWEIMP